MRTLVMAMVMLFLSTFFFVTNDAYAHGHVQSTWAETFDNRIVCSTDGAYSYDVLVEEKDESRKKVAMFLAGSNIMQAFNIRSEIMKNPETLRKLYDGNGVLVLHIKVFFQYPSCDIEAKRTKFLQQKTGH